MSGDRGGALRTAADVLEGLTTLAGGHAELAREELADNLRTTVRHVAGGLVGLVILQSGLMLTAAGAGLWLGRRLGDPFVGLLIAGLLLTAGGGLVAGWFWRGLARTRYLADSWDELRASGRWLQEQWLRMRSGGSA